MLRLLPAVVLLTAPAPLFAQRYYDAAPTTPPARASLVTRDTVWRCAGGSCTAAKAGSRDAIMCELLVREVGPLDRFTAGGMAFDADTLSACNARAKPASK